MKELGLARYDAMCNAITVCHDVDEVKEIRNRAKALEVYAQQALNTDAERRCGQIRLRAERRAGQLLREMKTNGQRRAASAGRPSKVSQGATLSNLGLTRDQSSQWQQLAEISEAEFEQELACPGPKPTTEGLLAKRKPPLVLPTLQMAPEVLQIWGRLKDFERYKLLALDACKVFDSMTDAMQDDVSRIAPALIAWLKGLRK